MNVSPLDAAAYRDAHPAQPLLIVEVADTSYRIGHDFKTSLYARAAVPEYWIVHLDRGIVEVHRGPERDETARYGWRYANVDALGAQATVFPLLAPAARITVADLLP